MPFSSLVSFLLVLAGSGGVLLSLDAMSKRVRRRKRLRRLAPVIDPRGLVSAVDRPISVQGVLQGGPIETGFGEGTRTIEVAHVNACALSSGEEPRLQMAGAVVWLTGPLQVVSGTRERNLEQGKEDLSARSVSDGDEVIAEGVLKRVPETQSSDGSYRELSFRYVLSPPQDPSWPGRPVSLQAARPPSVLRPLAPLVLALAFIGTGLHGLSRPSPLFVTKNSPALSGSAAPQKPVCAVEVATLLERNDPWAASERAQDCDPLSQAESAWMLGEVEQAAAAFRLDRETHPSRELTLSEVEASILSDPKDSVDLVRKLKSDWYRGPQDPSQAQLDCVIATLSGKRTFSSFCLSEHHRSGFYSQSRREIHHLPAYSLHEPDIYPRFQPVGSDENTYRVGCGSSFPRLEKLTDLDCRANIAASRALFAMIVGDSPWIERELQLVDQTLDELQRVQSLPPSHRVDPTTASSEPDELDNLRFRVEKVLAVAATTAWFIRDQKRLDRYLPRMEAHARAILTEHINLESGRQREPEPSHSPSDFSVVDMEIFRTADQEPPEVWLTRLKNLRYSSPTRLRVLLATRPSLREATAAWVREGFVPVCRTCGVYELLGATFRRREAARLIGDTQLTARLDAITQKLGKALLQDPGFGPVLSLESLVAR